MRLGNEVVSSNYRSSHFGKPAWVGLLAALVLPFGVGLNPNPAHADGPNRCKGAKVFHAGKCRYPDEVERLKAQQKAAAARRIRDRKRCQAAEQAGSLPEWRDYLRAHPNGVCRKQAQEQIERLEADQVVSPPTPVPEPSSSAVAAPADAELTAAGPSPLVYVGFGIGGAGLLTWIVTGSIAWSQSTSLEEVCSDTLCPKDRQGDLDGATTLAHVATVGLAVGAAGSVLGLVALLALGEDSSEPVGTARPLRPLIGDGLIGVRGSF